MLKTWTKPYGYRVLILNALDRFDRHWNDFPGWICTRCGEPFWDKQKLFVHRKRRMCDFPKKLYVQLELPTLEREPKKKKKRRRRKPKTPAEVELPGWAEWSKKHG